MTDVELECLAQTWSEHCKHKTFNSAIEYTETRGTAAAPPESIPNLLKDPIVKATHAIASPWCLSVFRDNAGVIDFDGTHAVCFKVETHNHPSAIEPYGGANTGLGGVIRRSISAGSSVRLSSISASTGIPPANTIAL